MHHSRLAGFIIDCHDKDASDGAAFWGPALGMSLHPRAAPYCGLDAGPRDLSIEVQRVAHDSRVHLDIEADDVEAEVKRLEALGAKRIEYVAKWWVLEAPTGHRFCVVPSPDITAKAGVTKWP